MIKGFQCSIHKKNLFLYMICNNVPNLILKLCNVCFSPCIVYTSYRLFCRSQFLYSGPFLTFLKFDVILGRPYLVRFSFIDFQQMKVCTFIDDDNIYPCHKYKYIGHIISHLSLFF